VRTRDPWSPPPTPFTAAHVAPLGITDKRLRSALDAGQITRLRHGVYVATDAVPEDLVHLHLLRSLAEQVAAPGRVASHETAALALGLPLLDTDRAASGPTRLTRQAAARERSRTASDRRIHLGSLPLHHMVTLPSGLVVTTPARTALDVAADQSLPIGLMIVDAAARLAFVDLAGSLDRRHYDNERFRAASGVALSEAVAHVRAPGAARRLLELLALVDVRRESPLESFSCGHMYLAAVPMPQLQVRVRTAAGTYPVDFRWEKYRVIGEADGEGKYRDPGEFIREKEREGHLRDAGNDVVRWTGREIFRTPHVVIERIMRALVAGGWSP
jgi:very-short-patch-repair endonuclease